MSLIQKILLVFVVISLFVLGMGGVWTFFSFTKVNEKETDSEINGQIQQIIGFIEKGMTIKALNEEEEISVSIITDTLNIDEKKHFYDTIAYHRASKAYINHRKISANKKINGTWYKIMIHNTLLEPEDTLYGTIVSITVITVILILVLLILGFVVFKQLLNPFHYSLSKIHDFNIQKGEPLRLPKTRTTEFEKLNGFINNMTERALHDYNNLREFSENIAHEIRTPLAVASGKLDLMLQNKSLDSKELDLISDAQSSLKKISKIQHALGILSSIQNQESVQSATVILSELLDKLIEQHLEIISLQEIKLTIDIEPNVQVTNDPILVEMLLTNLIQNAIKHNISTSGEIDIKLDSEVLIISNTGVPLNQSPEKMLERFKRNGNGNESLGLGLAIVDNICKKSEYLLNYQFDSNSHWHKLAVHFKTSKSIQN